MSLGARYEQGGGDPYEWLRGMSPGYTAEVEAVTEIGLGVSRLAAEAADLGQSTVDAVFWQWNQHRLPAVDAMPPELIVTFGVYELIRKHHRWVSMEYPHPGHVEYAIPTATMSTTYTYERGVFRSKDSAYVRYELITAIRSIGMPNQRRRQGKIEVALGLSANDNLLYCMPLDALARSAGDEVRDERVYIEARGMQPVRVELN